MLLIEGAFHFARSVGDDFELTISASVQPHSVPARIIVWYFSHSAHRSFFFVMLVPLGAQHRVDYMVIFHFGVDQQFIANDFIIICS